MGDKNCTCYDHCCNAETCQLLTNATCSAVDGCCDASTCTVAASGTVCRASLGSCDTAETCDGTSKSCPVDTITAYGTADDAVERADSNYFNAAVYVDADALPVALLECS